MNAPYGPTTTMGLNVVSINGLIVGLAFLVIPSLQAVPLPSILFAGVAGAGLISGFLFHILRWRRVLRRASDAAADPAVVEAFAFIQAMFTRPGTGLSQFGGSGWLLIRSDRVVICGARQLSNAWGAAPTRELLLRDVSSIECSEATPLSYSALRIRMSSGADFSFILVAEGGSPWRGPTEELTDRMRRRVQDVIDLGGTEGPCAAESRPTPDP